MELKNINMKERMQHHNVTGLSIALINKGQVSGTHEFGVLEAGSNYAVDSHSIFNACSMSKFLTSMLVMKLVSLGDLNLDEDVNNRLTSWKVPAHQWSQNKKVTLRMLVSHHAGIIDPDGSFTELKALDEAPSMVEILNGKTTYCSGAIEIKNEPGSDFQYSDAGFCIIQQLIEDSFGRPFEQLVKEYIFEPLEMNHSTLDLALEKEGREDFSCGHDKHGEVLKDKYPVYPYPAAAGFWTTPSDFATLVIELMNSLKGKGKIGISSDFAKDMISSQGKEWAGLGLFLDGTEENIEISSLGWGEGFQCMMVAYPYSETGAVIMTNTNPGVHQLKGIIGDIYQALSS